MKPKIGDLVELGGFNGIMISPYRALYWNTNEIFHKGLIDTVFGDFNWKVIPRL